MTTICSFELLSSPKGPEPLLRCGYNPSLHHHITTCCQVDLVVLFWALLCVTMFITVDKPKYIKTMPYHGKLENCPNVYMPPQSAAATPRVLPAVSDASDSSAYAKCKHDLTSDAEMEDVTMSPLPLLLDIPKKKKAQKLTSTMMTAPMSIHPVTPVQQGTHPDPKSSSTVDVDYTMMVMCSLLNCLQMLGQMLMNGSTNPQIKEISLS